MKLLCVLSLCLLQVVYGDDCEKSLRELAACIEEELIPQPETTNFKNAASQCFGQCRREPRLDYDEAKDGNAVTDCENKALKYAAGPMVEQCMAKHYPEWTYEVPLFTMTPGHPETIIRLAYNEIEDEEMCPPNVRDATVACLNRAIKSTLPPVDRMDTPQAIAQAQAKSEAQYCDARRSCMNRLAVDTGCLASESSRILRGCECSNKLQTRYTPAADAEMEVCVTSYTDAQIAKGIMRDYKQSRSMTPQDCMAIAKATATLC